MSQRLVIQMSCGQWERWSISSIETAHARNLVKRMERLQMAEKLLFGQLMAVMMKELLTFS